MAPFDGVEALTCLTRLELLGLPRACDVGALHVCRTLLRLQIEPHSEVGVVGLERLPDSLTSLDFWDATIPTLAPLAHLTALRDLTVSSDDAGSLAPLRGMLHLSSLVATTFRRYALWSRCAI